MFLSNPNYSESSSGIRSFMSNLPKEIFKIQSLKKNGTPRFFFFFEGFVSHQKKKKKSQISEESRSSLSRACFGFFLEDDEEEEGSNRWGGKNTQTNKKKQLHTTPNLNTCSVPVVEPDWMMACVQREKWKSSILSLNSSRCSRALRPLSWSHSNHLVPLCQKKGRRKKRGQNIKSTETESWVKSELK